MGTVRIVRYWTAYERKPTAGSTVGRHDRDCIRDKLAASKFGKGTNTQVETRD